MANFLEKSSPWIAGIGAGLGLIGSIGQMIGTRKANKQLEAIKAKVNAMGLNPEYAKQLALTQRQLQDRKSTRLNSSHVSESRMPSSA